MADKSSENLREFAKRRLDLEVMTDFLVATREHERKTQIMRTANLSSSMFTRYRSMLEEAGLILVEEDRYEITEKGSVFLQKNQKALQILTP